MSRDKTKFCDLPREEQLDIVNHVLDGGKIQEYDECWWEVDYLPDYEDGVYRKVTKPE